MRHYIDTSRSTTAGLYRGKWWRFSDYEYVNYRIRPTKDARLETYDPWAEYEAAWADKAAVDPRLSSVAALPYQRLFDLTDVKYKDAFCAEQGEQFAAWCREFGLLGLLPHRMISATFPATWGAPIGSGESSLIEIKSWVPSADSWRTWDSQYYREPGKSQEGIRRRMGTLVPNRLLPEDAPRSQVVMRDDAWSFEVSVQSVTEAISPYFPRVPERNASLYDYPCPLTERFWREYGEAIWDIECCVSEFKRAVRILTRASQDPTYKPPLEFMVREAEITLAALASNTRPLLSVHGLSLHQTWVSSSLISALAMMAMNDLMNDKIQRCGARGCERIFASSSPKAKFCSGRCRDREIKARYRAKKKLTGSGKPDKTRRGTNHDGKKTR